MKASVGFFEDDSGKPSPLRWISFAALVAAIAFGYLTFLMPSKAAGVEISCGFLAAAFGPKAAKKFADSQNS